MPKTTTFDTTQVLKKATTVFHAKGYNGSSMQDLVDATGLNRSSIYNSFGSKLELFLKVLSSYDLSNQQLLSKQLLGAHNAIEKLDVFFKFYIDQIVADQNQNGCLLLNTKSEMMNQDAKIRSFIIKNKEQTIARLEDIIYNGQMERIINDKISAHQYAIYLYSALQGIQMTGIINANPDELLHIKNMALNVVAKN